MRIHTVVIPLSMVAFLLLVGCAPKVLVGPRIDLKTYGRIGVFAVNTNSKGSLGDFATHQFIEAIQEAQPGIPVLELGAWSGASDPASLSQIGETHKVDAVFVGELEISKVKPRMDLSLVFASMDVQAIVEANFRMKFLDTRTGAVLWTRSGSSTEEVAHVSFSKASGASFDARDPERAYGTLIQSLVGQITYDFRSRWERSR